ncbi:MAG: LamG domain-containing protein [Gammaproteobacteria bacterium]|nr:LamG domain-containing protein [Gammaproteobacteria bacterium]
MFDGDGTDGGANNTFTDSSTNGFTVTENGSVVQGSFSPYGANWSNYFNGTDYLYGTVNALGTGDFTLECWVNFSSLGANRTIMSFGSYSPALFYRHASTELAVYHGGAFYLSGFTPEVGEWYHVAFTRSGTTSRMFVNGTQQGSDTTYSTNITDTTLRIGYDGVDYTDAYISNVRVVKGTALYTSNFTAPTSPLSAVTNTELLTCQSNRFVDNGSNSITVSVNSTPEVTPFSPFKDDDARDITTDGGSGLSETSSDYLAVSSSINAKFGTSDFTVEGWIYPKDLTNQYNTIFDYGTDAGTTGAWWALHAGSGGTIELHTNNGGLQIVSSSGVVRVGEWNHFAVVRSGNTFTVYVNGVNVGSTTASYNMSDSSTRTLYTYYQASTGRNFNGYLSDARIVRGTAVYTSAFTPPTAPLTAVTNTELLLNFQDAGIYDRTGLKNLDTGGNTKIDTAIKKYGTGSVKFDGTGDYCLLPSSEQLAMGTGDFTIEMWVNLNSLTNSSGSQDGVFVEMRSSGATSSGFVFNCRPSSTNFVLNFYTNGGANVATTGMAYDTWHHIAVSRESGTVRLFVNGAVDKTFTKTNNFSDAPDVTIGQSLLYSSSNIVGYIDDLRITKGVARYTSNFTAPTAALPKF